jgi:hypothetical protein
MMNTCKVKHGLVKDQRWCLEGGGNRRLQIFINLVVFGIVAEK